MSLFFQLLECCEAAYCFQAAPDRSKKKKIRNLDDLIIELKETKIPLYPTEQEFVNFYQESCDEKKDCEKSWIDTAITKLMKNHFILNKETNHYLGRWTTEIAHQFYSVSILSKDSRLIYNLIYSKYHLTQFNRFHNGIYYIVINVITPK